MIPRDQLSDADRERGDAIENARNTLALFPIHPHGHWRPFVRNVDSYDGILVRKVKFIGVDAGRAQFGPDDLYIWQEDRP